MSVEDQDNNIRIYNFDNLQEIKCIIKNDIICSISISLDNKNLIIGNIYNFLLKISILFINNYYFIFFIKLKHKNMITKL